MKWKIVEKTQLPAVIGELTKEYEVFAPVKEKNVVHFKRLSFEDEPCLNIWNVDKPPKEVFFPQTETLFTYTTGKENVELVEAPAAKAKRVLLGVRPCDARSFVLLDKFLSSGEHKDLNYSEKRKNTTVLGLACNNPRSTCFCTSLGGNPSGKEGMDVILQDIGDAYLIGTITEKGEELVQKLSRLKDAAKGDVEKAKKLSEDAEDAVKSKFSVKEVSENLDRMFDDPFWDQIHRRCLGCGICTFLCPTCCCFDILDEEMGERKRVRIWDSCQFPYFTLHGSGHNPRPSGMERMRQRIQHKFNYFVKDYGESFCVGCGRCVQECPVNFDIREIIQAISAKQV